MKLLIGVGICLFSHLLPAENLHNGSSPSQRPTSPVTSSGLVPAGVNGNPGFSYLVVPDYGPAPSCQGTLVSVEDRPEGTVCTVASAAHCFEDELKKASQRGRAYALNKPWCKPELQKEAVSWGRLKIQTADFGMVEAIGMIHPKASQGSQVHDTAVFYFNCPQGAGNVPVVKVDSSPLRPGEEFRYGKVRKRLGLFQGKVFGKRLRAQSAQTGQIILDATEGTSRDYIDQDSDKTIIQGDSGGPGLVLREGEWRLGSILSGYPTAVGPTKAIYQSEESMEFVACMAGKDSPDSNQGSSPPLKTSPLLAGSGSSEPPVSSPEASSLGSQSFEFRGNGQGQSNGLHFLKPNEKPSPQNALYLKRLPDGSRKAAIKDSQGKVVILGQDVQEGLRQYYQTHQEKLDKLPANKKAFVEGFLNSFKSTNRKPTQEPLRTGSKQSFDCVASGDGFQPKKSGENFPLLGASTFTNKDQCEKAVTNARNGVVCTPAGDGFKATHQSGAVDWERFAKAKSFGYLGGGSLSFEECLETTLKSTDKAICYRSASIWLAGDISGSGKLSSGISRGPYDTLTDCLAAIKTVPPHAAPQPSLGNSSEGSLKISAKRDNSQSIVSFPSGITQPKKKTGQNHNGFRNAIPASAGTAPAHQEAGPDLARAYSRDLQSKPKKSPLYSGIARCTECHSAGSGRALILPEDPVQALKTLKDQISRYGLVNPEIIFKMAESSIHGALTPEEKNSLYEFLFNTSDMSKVARLEEPSKLPTQKMSTKEIETIKNMIPDTSNPFLNEILKSPSTRFVTDQTREPLYQITKDTYGAGEGIKPRNSANNLGPLGWNDIFSQDPKTGIVSQKGMLGSPAGLHEASRGDYRVIRFERNPTENGKSVPIEVYKIPSGIDSHSIETDYPVGTVFGEMVLVKDPTTGKEHVQQIRLRSKTGENQWQPDIYTAFPASEDLSKRIKEVWPDDSWQHDPELSRMVAHLDNPIELKEQTVQSNYAVPVYSGKGGVDKLPPLSPEKVSKLIQGAQLQSSLNQRWRTEGDVVSYSPTTESPFHIVPKNYSAHSMEVSQQSCMRCHQDAGTNFGVIHPDARRNDGAPYAHPDAYGRVYGSGGIFTFHPFRNGAATLFGNGHRGAKTDNRYDASGDAKFDYQAFKEGLLKMK